MTCTNCEHTGKPCGGPDCAGATVLADPAAALPGAGVPTPALDGNNLAAISHRFTQFAAELRGLLLNDCIRFQTVLFDANGVADMSQFADIPFAGIAVWNIGDNAATVESGPLQGSAPAQGIGVMRIPAGCSAGWPSTGTALTMYGTAGQPIAVALYSKPIQPFASGGGGGSSSGGSATPSDTTANPTTASLAESFGMVWSGTNWERARSVGVGDETNGTGLVAVGPVAKNPLTGNWDMLRTWSSNTASSPSWGVLAAAQPPSSMYTATAAANTAVQIANGVGPSAAWRCTMLVISWTGAAPAAGTLLTIKDGATIKFSTAVPAALGPFQVDMPPGGLSSTAGNDLVIGLAAGGAGAIGTINAGLIYG